MLTTQDVCELCDLPVTTLTDWVAKGFVAPSEKGGKGRGNSHRFDLMRAVGIVVAARLHQSDRGCVPEYVRKVVESFAAITEAELRRRFMTMGTHFVTERPEGPIMQGKQSYWVDVRAAYRAVKAKVAEIDKSEKGSPGGRTHDPRDVLTTERVGRL